MENTFDLIVLGAGSGGLAAAKRAASYGAKVAIVEGDRVGGTCVIRGCVPKKLLVYGSSYRQYIKNADSYGITFKDVKIDSQILLQNTRKEVDRLNDLHTKNLEKAGVELIKGWAEFKDPNSILIKNISDNQGEIEIEAKKILIAVGGSPIRPDIKGASLGWVSDDMFALNSFPDEIVIVGGGFIACEFACILNGFGAKVSQFVRGDNLLRGFDLELSDLLKDEMVANGIELNFGQSISGIDGKENDLTLTTNTKQTLKTKGVLFATGRNPSISRLKLENAGIESINNKINVDKNNLTSISNIYAIGDVTNRINLTPVAIDEGRKFADKIWGNGTLSVNYSLIPKAVFSSPEIAAVGLTEEGAIEKYGLENIKVFRSKFKPMSQSLPKSGKLCLLKLIVKRDNHKIVGCHMAGENSAEIIQMAAIALRLGATKIDFDKTMALHPTIAEEFVTMNA
ncbi:glutathione-disulfide reductase [Prochlorococcus sp. MIT 1223]|uniref:glutathione-disulfide reductase n=1 Tax=Prochlorococcus sp. MIT 1223 TaxID=3096217 RepID=UPI002A761BEE|nr:glutathione-disulfide reductase [Prochlorococcus sp. MIT 1223]